MQPNPPPLVYKILTAALWNNGVAENVPSMPIDEADGFIHLSSASQLAETLALHFKGQSGLIVLSIRTIDLGDTLKWEPSRGGQLFPHVYGQVPRTAVAAITMVDVADDGGCTLPAEIR